ncbi:MAG: TIGR04086 family membrane protein [Clostridiales bacterium]|nr:TIGR04086 family membrane protein [Clostridiales bacterium]
MGSDKKNKGNEKGWLRVIKASLIACALSVALVVAFAFVLQKQWLGIGSVGYINTGVKVISAAAAALIATRGASKGTLLRGALAGGAYMIITFLVFSLLSGEFRMGTGTLTDLLMCVLGGAVIGVIRNLRR